ncbi:hypothetical protein AHMF7605_11835 [Adhaeribacter arboris]|uniref:Uncharacterized protein n=1 Tax=Adhaeribacter arboris TaxID=2072846 RepID=A0A2T2YF85_9BACT|nr:hypothetical protein [Adhaeribacter arboris]PSR54162.1 hypothetical protein AHMF7605_11835 [Adhaeribacter arboris]
MSYAIVALCVGIIVVSLTACVYFSRKAAEGQLGQETKFVILAASSLLGGTFTAISLAVNFFN